MAKKSAKATPQSNFQIFAESATDMQTDIEYSTDSQRINGVEPGLAKAELHNKLYRQATVMVAALAQVLVERGFSAMDNDYNGLVAAIRQAFTYSVNDIKPGTDGNIDYDLLSFNDIYPVGSIVINADGTNPGTRFGGTWQQIAGGRCIIGANSTYPAGSTGGEATHKLTANEIPSHKHSASLSSAGGHKHNRGTMNITGKFIQAAQNDGSGIFEGAFANAGYIAGECAHKSDGRAVCDFSAARAWTGETNSAGDHGHTVTIGNTGGGQAHNNMQPYLAVYIWQRTA